MGATADTSRRASRETFECGLRLGRDALEAMEIAHFRARDMVHTFRQHNIRAIESLRVLIDDDDKLVSAAKAGRDALYA